MTVQRWVCCLAGLAWVLLVCPAYGQVYWVEAPSFVPPWTGCIPEFGDLDGDADLDLIYARALKSYENVGSPQLPVWERNDGFIEGVTYLVEMTVCLADLDGDGDLDLSAGLLSGDPYWVRYYENVGTPIAPEWEAHHEVYEGVEPGAETFPELADLDGDADLDLVVSTTASLTAYRNTGDAQAPVWERDDSLCAGLVLPYGHVDANFGDIDGDGDLDVVIGSTFAQSPIVCFENVGTPSVPTWVENEDLLIGVDRFVDGRGLDLVDIDGDGDLDLFVIDVYGPTFYLNCGSETPVEPTSWGRIKALFR